MAEASETAWFVYVLRCRGERLYCGIATDVEARFEAHCSGRGAKFTRAFPPLSILAVMQATNRSEALREEAAFKRLARAAKLRRLADARWKGSAA
jgi:putative endonuclease